MSWICVCGADNRDTFSQCWACQRSSCKTSESARAEKPRWLDLEDRYARSLREAEDRARVERQAEERRKRQEREALELAARQEKLEMERLQREAKRLAAELESRTDYETEMHIKRRRIDKQRAWERLTDGQKRFALLELD